MRRWRPPKTHGKERVVGKMFLGGAGQCNSRGRGFITRKKVRVLDTSHWNYNSMQSSQMLTTGEVLFICSTCYCRSSRDSRSRLGILFNETGSNRRTPWEEKREEGREEGFPMAKSRINVCLFTHRGGAFVFEKTRISLDTKLFWRISVIDCRESVFETLILLKLEG
ncbi:LAFA_0F03334g1_1 [Lachancea sp. 'fantastica']|nr:LAFA_0F03334g1_1 [Lachancea sp. 'fantastica']